MVAMIREQATIRTASGELIEVTASWHRPKVHTQMIRTPDGQHPGRQRIEWRGTITSATYLGILDNTTP